MLSILPRLHQPVIRIARNDVDVQMEHVLPACRAVGLEEGQPIGPESLLDEIADGVRGPSYCGE